MRQTRPQTAPGSSAFVTKMIRREYSKKPEHETHHLLVFVQPLRQPRADCSLLIANCMKQKSRLTQKLRWANASPSRLTQPRARQLKHLASRFASCPLQTLLRQRGVWAPCINTAPFAIINFEGNQPVEPYLRRKRFHFMSLRSHKN